jgi:hypothetical protein
VQVWPVRRDRKHFRLACTPMRSSGLVSHGAATLPEWAAHVHISAPSTVGIAGLYHPSCSATFRRVPSPVISTSTTSPAMSRRGGLLKSPTPAWRAGHDDIVSLQWGKPRDVADKLRHGEDQVCERCRLSNFAVDPCFKMQFCHVFNVRGRCEVGPEGAPLGKILSRCPCGREDCRRSA